ncbi:DivIVA domain-containing protein [Mesomycoplasma molare]|uniref:DivIVA domain-containing protein n=1 Tax=Mesomycoplasma molare TaxID=171288 RepID=A0ABY5TUD2_9BACT|nr:DivIVA domain-containing protein [Mesomycoplasma molare]UWD33929.1 DivIVA domain-containing protein [Mesomycoplasma molare]
MNNKDFIKNIQEKKFDTVINGYNPTQVDNFIDNVLEENKKKDEIIEIYKLKNEELLEKIKKMKLQVSNLELQNNQLKNISEVLDKKPL